MPRIAHHHLPLFGTTFASAFVLTLACVALSSFTTSALNAQERSRPPGVKLDAGEKNQSRSAAAPSEPTGDQGAEKERMRSIDQSWMSEIHGKSAGAGVTEEPKDSGSTEKETQRFNNPPGQDSVKEGQAAAPTRETPELFATGEDGPSFFSIVFRFLGLAALMILVLYAGLRLVRNKAGPLMGAGDLVQVIATVPLMQGRFLQIVDLAGQLLVLGVSDSGVHLVAEIDDARVGDRVRLWQAERARIPTPAGILEQLTGILKKTDFQFWHAEGRARSDGPGFKEWLGRYAPAARSGGDPLEEAALRSVLGDRAGVPLEDIPPNADQESLSALLKSQRQKLSSMQRRPSRPGST